MMARLNIDRTQSLNHKCKTINVQTGTKTLITMTAKNGLKVLPKHTLEAYNIRMVSYQ